MLDQLGIDKSFFFQLGVSAFYFIVVGSILLSKLERVIFEREEKTTLLESKAEGMFERVNALAEKYNSRVKEAKSEAQKIFNDNKLTTNTELNLDFEKYEQRVESEYNQNKAKIVSDLAILEKDLLKSSTDIEEALLNKLS